MKLPYIDMALAGWVIGNIVILIGALSGIRLGYEIEMSYLLTMGLGLNLAFPSGLWLGYLFQRLDDHTGASGRREGPAALITGTLLCAGAAILYFMLFFVFLSQ